MSKATIHNELIEMMLFYWEQVSNREKVADTYLIEMAKRDEMGPVYTEDFTEDSFRRVLSAISNRELLNKPTKAESRFWNLNMWMIEDMETCRAMIQPIKQLNPEEIGLQDGQTVYFVPGHLDEYYKTHESLYINFFKIMLDYDTREPKIGDKTLAEYIKSQF